MSLLEVSNLDKAYPDGWTLSDVSFEVEEGEILYLLGPSGSGKTTLLRLTAGLETPDGGRIRVNGDDVTRVPPHRRGFGLMFQEYALFPHKDVFGNVAFGLRMAGWPRPGLEARVEEVLDLVGLAGFGHRDVSQLSGGERQRVALARSLAPQPRLLMLDEPLGALDRTLRERLMAELPDILKGVGVTTISVTHDQEEAFAVADRVAVMRAGRLVQRGTPEAVYRCPASAWVARFFGLTNLFPAQVVGPEEVESPFGRLRIEADEEWTEGAEVTLLVRPEAAQMDGSEVNQVKGEVTERVFHGSYYQVELALAGDVTLDLEWPVGSSVPEWGSSVTLTLDPGGLMLLQD
jgi:ABC-type Fe3+/spermidine/putrescine transport system ATPase subunit